ncbi:uncharacterized protein [Asterias amurensis]|uniref:uncharacterized protein n=1 Tax=Asterias amurensis TaxID=7602 RepID=UPI003AB3875B
MDDIHTHSETGSDVEDQEDEIAQSIHSVLPAIQPHRFMKLVTCLQRLGVVCKEDMTYLVEDDMVPALTKIEARKLLSGVKVKGVPEKAPAMESSVTEDDSSSAAGSSVPEDDSSSTASGTSPMSSTASSVQPSVPWRKMSKELLSCVQANLSPSPSMRKEMIRVIIDDLHKPNTPLPRTKTLRSIAQEVIRKYPKSFIDEVDGEQIGSGYDSILSQLVNRVDNISRSQLSTKRKSSPDNASATPVSKRKRDSYGCINWEPSSFPQGQTQESQNELKEQLKQLHKSEPHTKTSEVMDLMGLTYRSQRLAINKPTCVFLDLTEQWPYLFDERFMLEHFKELVGIDVKVKLTNIFEDKVPKLLRFLKQGVNNKKVQTVLTDIEKANREVGDHTPQVIGLILLLCSYFGEDEACHVISRETLGYPMEKDRLPANPCLVSYSRPLQSSRFSLAIGKFLVADLANPLSALSMWFCAYYCFNLKYPNKSEGVLEFIQRCFLGLNPGTGSKSGRKKPSVHPGVLKLANSMKVFENEWDLN